MTRHLGFDFGTTSTVIASIDDQGEPYVLVVPRFSVKTQDPNQETHGVPSVIHFNSHDVYHIGGEVLQHNELNSPSTYRWMKSTIVENLHDSPRILDDSSNMTTYEAARTFIKTLVSRVESNYGEFNSLCFTLPVHSFSNYQEWLLETALECGVKAPVFIDEATAAAVGYSKDLKIGDKFIVIDFGGGTLDISIVQVKKTDRESSHRISVLGISGTPLGGRDIDGWLLQHAAREFGRGIENLNGSATANDLLINCERAKERLSFEESTTIDLFEPNTGSIKQITLSRSRFEELLDSFGMFDKIEDCLRSALNQARNNGLDESEIKTVLLVGGSTLIPSVKQHFSRRFGAKRVETEQPFSAVAIGAARIAAGQTIDNRIFHEYSIRYLNEDGVEKFEPIIPPGQEFPIERLWSREVTSTRAGQRKFTIEIHQRDVVNIDSDEKAEIVFSDTGFAKFLSLTKKKQNVRMQKLSSKTIFADASTHAGQPCLSIRLDIDAHRRLLITVRDIRSIPNELLLENSPLSFVR
jgi:molecular chaperone DnaK